MGREWIDGVMTQLRQEGYPVRRGFPVGKMPHLTAPAIAVCVEKLLPGAMTLRLDIYSPLKLGGGQCEDTTMAVVSLLARENGTVSAGACRFDENLGLFTQSVRAEFAEEAAE